MDKLSQNAIQANNIITNPAGGIKAIENCGDTGCLFNIMEDPEDRISLADKKTRYFKMMQQKIAEYQATTSTQNMVQLRLRPAILQSRRMEALGGHFCFKCSERNNNLKID